MPDDLPSVPPAAPDPVPDATPDVIPVPEANPGLDLGPGPGINIAEEFGTAKRNLPPAKIVGIVLAVAVVVVGIFAFLERAKPQGGGSIDNIAVRRNSQPEFSSAGGERHRTQLRRKNSVDP